MCGIAGIWNLDGRPVAATAIDRFTDALAHRGPDGRGTWRDDRAGIALGHRRLSILDLTDDGSQPMSGSDGRWWIVYNGEIYNFVELRSELEGKGHRFRSSSDTEVLLAAWAQWGEAMLARFNGMWAFAIFDRKQRSLFMARDRFGIKPFLYRFDDGQFAFASELKAFRRLDGYVPGIDRESAGRLLADGFALEGTPRTLLAGVRRLPAGHLATLSEGRLEVRRWWNTLDHLETPPPTLHGQAERFRELLYDAVKLRMRSDVPIGSCLSGGFDSSAVVCALAEIGRTGGISRQAGDWQHTFVATFPGAFNDESAEAAQVVEYAGVKGHFFPVTESDALADLDRILDDFDDVYIGLPTAPWLIYRELRRAGVKVSLDGHGADELMGAYAQADQVLLHDAPSLLFAPGENLRRLAEYRAVAELLKARGVTGGLRSPLGALLAHHPSLRSLRRAWQGVKPLRRRVAGEEFLRRRRFAADPDFVPPSAGDRLPDSWGETNRTLYTMFHATLLPAILRNFDRLSMAHGIEVRMPFMDWRLACYVFSLPDSAKLGGGMTKRVAREAMIGRMPETIRSARYKIGFNSPMPEWLNGPLREWADGLAQSVEVSGHDLIDGKLFAAYVRSLGREQGWNWQNCGRAWPVLHYLWYEKALAVDRRVI